MKRLIFLAICLLALTNATFAEGKYQRDTLVDSEPILSRITAYAPYDNKSGMCADGNPMITSRGYRPNRHYAAVDPRKIPYGTVIFIPGYGEVIAADTGGALRAYDGVAIDVFFETYEEAIQFGKRMVRVRIIERRYEIE